MKLLLRLGTKEFQSGLSMMGAHAERGGLFFDAAGVTPLFGAGSALSVNNGLLTAGAEGTAITETLGGNIINMIADTIFYTNSLLMACSDNKVYKLSIADPVSASVAEAFTSAGTLTGGMVVFQLSTGTKYVFYHRTDYIGRHDGTNAGDTWQAVTSDYWGAMHVHYGLNKIIFGNGRGKLGTIDSAGAVTLAALTYDLSSNCTALSDDGVYVIAAITRNVTGDTTMLDDTRILFWDGSTTTGFVRDYPITDPFIYALKKTPTGVFAYGVTGIWQVSFDGVKKVFSHNPGVYTVSGASVIHYGKGATSFFSDALLWGGNVGSSTTRALKSFGKLDSMALSAYLQPVKLTTNKNITAVNAQVLKGYVFVADSTPALLYYPIGSGTQQTSISAQTVYFQLPTKHTISYIDVVFGEPLASGDSVSIQLKSDEDASVTPTIALTATYADDGATRRKRVKIPNYIAESQLSLVINFTAGAVKVKRIDVYGSPVPNAAD